MSQTITLPIRNMTCGGCAARVSRTLEQLPGAAAISVNLADESAQLSLEDGAQVRSAADALSQAGYPVREDEVTLLIEGMHCASCVGRVERALAALSGVLSAQVNLAAETATVQYVPGLVTPAEIAEASTAAGYPSRLAGGAEQVDRAVEKEAETAQTFRNFLIAALLTAPVFLLEMGGHLIPAWHHLIMRTLGTELNWMIQFALTTLVLAGPGRGFLVRGLPALWRGAPTMDSLVALGAGAAWVFSTVALFVPDVLPQGTRAVYFEAAAVIVTLILLGRWFEARAKGQTGAAVRKLVGLQPATALVRQEDGWTEVPVAALNVDQEFLLRPGARVPTDAIVVSGDSRVDESMITGEPMPVGKGAGDALTGGSVNEHGTLVARATRIGAETTLAQIIRMVEQAQAERLPIQALVDRVTLWFVPAVIGVALVAVVAWLIFGPAPALSFALVIGVSVLIIACPCAMGLATPTSIMVGTGRAAELGVLFRQGDALQSLSGVQVVALDKTGTLTQGKPALTTFDVMAEQDADALLAAVAALEDCSEHPIARAIVEKARAQGIPLPEVREVQTKSGMGLVGKVAEDTIAVGNARLMASVGADVSGQTQLAERLEAAGETVFFAARNGKLAAVLAVSDPVRPTSRDAIAQLKDRGLKVAMITGDGEGTARAVADQLGIDTVVAGVLPDGKTEALGQLRAAHGATAFVGDGINDAPVLAEADVGIAIGTGTDVAIETADVVLMSGDVLGVVRAFDVSVHTLRNIKQNLVWAFGYNVLLIPVAAGVLFPAYGLLLSPGLAAGAMAFSSVFVLGNALRLRRLGIAP